MSYEMFQKGPSVWVPVVLGALLITLLAYGAFPIVFAYARKRPIIIKKYRRCCYVVNAVVVCLFIIANSSSNIFPYLLWTEIFVRIGLKRLESKDLAVNHGACVNLPKGVDFAMNQDGCCSSCGGVLVTNALVCDRCGAQIDNVTERKIKPVKASDNFIDENGWAKEIASLDSDEIHRRYRDKEEWSKNYRALCYEEILRRKENNQQ